MRESELDDLRRRLLREGVKPSCVRRTLQELDDHYHDLFNQAVADGRSEEQAADFAGLRMGDAEGIAGEILARPELRSWAHRYPKTFFVLGPLLVYVAVITLVALLVIGMALLTRHHSPAGIAALPVWMRTLVDASMFFLKYILGQALIILLFLSAYQRRAAFLWPSLGIIILVLVSSGFTGDVVWPIHAGEKGTLSIGMGVDATRLIITLCLTSLFAVLYRSFRYKNEGESAGKLLN